jgi:hypothetical protein
MKRLFTLLVLALAMLPAFSQPSAGLWIKIANAMQQPQTNRTVNVKYAAPSVNGDEVILTDLAQFVTDSTGSCYVTNAVSGWYDITVLAPPNQTKYVVYVVSNLTTLVNFTNFFSVPANTSWELQSNGQTLPSGQAWSIATSEARYILNPYPPSGDDGYVLTWSYSGQDWYAAPAGAASQTPWGQNINGNGFSLYGVLGLTNSGPVKFGGIPGGSGYFAALDASGNVTAAIPAGSGGGGLFTTTNLTTNGGKYDLAQTIGPTNVAVQGWVTVAGNQTNAGTLTATTVGAVTMSATSVLNVKAINLTNSLIQTTTHANSFNAGAWSDDGMGDITAVGFSGIGSSLTSLNASALAAGTLPGSVFPSGGSSGQYLELTGTSPNTIAWGTPSSGGGGLFTTTNLTTNGGKYDLAQTIGPTNVAVQGWVTVAGNQSNSGTITAGSDFVTNNATGNATMTLQGAAVSGQDIIVSYFGGTPFWAVGQTPGVYEILGNNGSYGGIVPMTISNTNGAVTFAGTVTGNGAGLTNLMSPQQLHPLTWFTNGLNCYDSLTANLTNWQAQGGNYYSIGNSMLNIQSPAGAGLTNFFVNTNITTVDQRFEYSFYFSITNGTNAAGFSGFGMGMRGSIPQNFDFNLMCIMQIQANGGGANQGVLSWCAGTSNSITGGSFTTYTNGFGIYTNFQTNQWFKATIYKDDLIFTASFSNLATGFVNTSSYFCSNSGPASPASSTPYVWSPCLFVEGQVQAVVTNFTAGPVGYLNPDYVLIGDSVIQGTYCTNHNLSVGRRLQADHPCLIDIVDEPSLFLTNVFGSRNFLYALTNTYSPTKGYICELVNNDTYQVVPVATAVFQADAIALMSAFVAAGGKSNWFITPEVFGPASGTTASCSTNFWFELNQFPGQVIDMTTPFLTGEATSSNPFFFAADQAHPNEMTGAQVWEDRINAKVYGLAPQ